MDKQFLEFLGNFYLNAARGQKQLEDMTRWMGLGFSGFDELTHMFRKIYGLEKPPLEAPDYTEACEKAFDSFKTSFNDWLKLMSMVPEHEHLALKKKYDALKAKVAAQDETIEHLRTLLSEKGVRHTDAIHDFTEMMGKQARQFQDLMESIRKALKTQ
jgi:hypothetical protein